MMAEYDTLDGGSLDPWIRGDTAAQEAAGEADGFRAGYGGHGCPDGFCEPTTPYAKGFGRGYDRGMEQREQERKHHA